MDDQRREYIIGITIKTLGISREQAELRLEALLQSKVLQKYGSPKPEDKMFQVIVDICMNIPQLLTK